MRDNTYDKLIKLLEVTTNNLNELYEVLNEPKHRHKITEEEQEVLDKTIFKFTVAIRSFQK